MNSNEERIQMIREAMNYSEAKELINDRYTRNHSRKLANNTYLKEESGYYAIELHGSQIIKLYPDYMILDTCGYRTLTTKDRLNRFTPVNIYQESFIWYIGTWETKDPIAFFDNIKIDYNGNVLNETGADIVQDTKELNKKIKAYVKGYMKDLINEIDLPGPGDCFYCSMVTTEGEHLGDLTNSDHLLSHIEESYYVPSLVYNAVAEAGYKYPMLIISGYKCNDLTILGKMGGQGCMIDSVKRSLTRYLQKRLLHTQ